MTTPFAALGTHGFRKSAAHAPANAADFLSPFALMDPMAKEAGFFGDVGSSIWDHTGGALGRSIGQMGQGIGNIAGGLSEGIGNTLKTIPRAIGGAVTGGLNNAFKGYQQNGQVNLGDLWQGARDGGWNAGKQSLGWAADGAKKNLAGWGGLAAGAGKTLWNGSIPGMMINGATGLGQGVMTGGKNWMEDQFKQWQAAQGGAAPGGVAPGSNPGGAPGTPGAIAQGPPAPAPTTGSSAPIGTGGNPLFNTLTGGQGPVGGVGGGPAPTPPNAFNGLANAMPAGAAPSGGTDWGQQFKQNTGTAYNPVSPMDRANMQNLQHGQPTMNHQQWRQQGQGQVAGMQKSWSFTPFASLSKEANFLTTGMELARPLMDDAAKGFGRAAKGVGRAAEEAAPGMRTAKGRVIDAELIPHSGVVPNTSIIPHAGGGPAGPDFLSRLKSFARTPAGMATGVGLGGAGLYGSNRMGHSSGMQEGLGIGYDAGSNMGLQAALQSQPGDPGFLGRLLNVFRGNPTGPDAMALRNMLDQSKHDVLGTILRGTA